MTKTTEKLGAVRLLEAIRRFSAAWEQHESLIPRWESKEEAAARMAARDALTVVEDRARWLDTELQSWIEHFTCDRCLEEVCPHGWCDCYDQPCPQCSAKREAEKDAEREANWQRNVIGPMLFGSDEEA